MLTILRNAWKIPELRGKLVFTLIIIILYRLGTSVPVPFIDSYVLSDMFAAHGDTILGFMNILSGQAFERATLFALSISPYITASIVMQLLTIAIPALERLSKSGEEGKKKISQITRYATVALGLITGYGYYIFLLNGGALLPAGRTFFGGTVIVACYVAGASLIMWLGEKINESGIGNGISIILFANIISVLPVATANTVSRIWYAVVDLANDAEGASLGVVINEIVIALVILAVALVIVAFVVFMSNAERRIPIQYSKRVVGRKMYGGQNTHLPIKVNMSGVMPIIFASSIVSIPITIITFMGGDRASTGVMGFIHDFFSPTSVLYIVLTFLLIIAFSYFYISISFNPIEVSNNIKKNGGFIPGIRPGKPTSDFISKILRKIVFIGGLFLAVIAAFPLTANAISFAITMQGSAIAFGGTSLLIVVGVALETTREMEAQMTMRHYKGFLE